MPHDRNSETVKMLLFGKEYCFHILIYGYQESMDFNYLTFLELLIWVGAHFSIISFAT